MSLVCIYLPTSSQPMAERIALGIVHRPFIAQELAQEALLEAYLALAVVANAPIFVTDEILDTAGTAIPAGKTPHRSDAPVTVEQQHAMPAMTLDEKLTKVEYEKHFQRVLNVLIR